MNRRGGETFRVGEQVGEVEGQKLTKGTSNLYYLLNSFICMLGQSNQNFVFTLAMVEII
jgi:hypothetical protein